MLMPMEREKLNCMGSVEPVEHGSAGKNVHPWEQKCHRYESTSDTFHEFPSHFITSYFKEDITKVLARVGSLGPNWKRFCLSFSATSVASVV